MTAPHYADDAVTLYAGDCLAVLPTLPDNSVDCVVTDPPYGLEFMGKEWDGPKLWREYVTDADKGYVSDGRTAPKFQTSRPTYAAGLPFQRWCQLWAAECLRVLRPGGHLLAFGGTRTWHRLAVAIEDAGFEIRDTIAWLYGSGFPKSLDVSKAIDRKGGNPLAFQTFARAYAATVAASPLTHSDIDRRLGIKSSSCYWAREDYRGGMPPRHHWETVRLLLDLDESFERLYDEAEREVIGQSAHKSGIGNATAGHYTVGGTIAALVDITAPATADAQRWQGWGTALKPAHEPIVVARKPLAGTVAANVLAHGTGALNIDGCRIGCDTSRADRYNSKAPGGSGFIDHAMSHTEPWQAPAGRWPANVALDETAAAALDHMSEGQRAAKPSKSGSASGDKFGGALYGSGLTGQGDINGYADTGGASRFFYTAKADSGERITHTKKVLRLRPDLTPEQVDHVRARLVEVGVQVDLEISEVPLDIRAYFEEVVPESGGLIAHPT